MDREKLEERWDELMPELGKINRSFPSVEKLRGWIPIDIVEERGIVIAEKEIDRKFISRKFEPLGI